MLLGGWNDDELEEEEKRMITAEQSRSDRDHNSTYTPRTRRHDRTPDRAAAPE
jgi:hypothetical protein